jgi:MFS transporter, DHA1 family, multidrug resistance protein
MARRETTLLAVTIALVEFVHGALLIVLLPTMLAQKYEWAMGTTGAAVSTYFFTEVSFKLVAGWLVDRIGTRKMLLWGFWLYLAAFTWLILGTHTWEVFVAIGAMGAGASPLWPAALTRLTKSGEGEGTGGMLGRVFSTWFLGAAAGVGLATLISRATNPVSLRIFILPLLIAALMALRLPPDAGERRAVVLRPVWRIIPLILRSIARLALSIIPQIIAAGVLIPIVVPYFEFVRGLDERELFLLLVLGPGTMLALLAPAGRIGDRFGRERTYSIGLGAVAVMLLLIPFAQSLWMLTLLFIGVGIAYAFVLPAWNSILLRILPEDVRGAGLGTAMTIEGMGGVVGPLVGGILWQYANNPSSPFYLSGGLLLLAAGASTRWRTGTAGQ